MMQQKEKLFIIFLAFTASCKVTHFFDVNKLMHAFLNDIVFYIHFRFTLTYITLKRLAMLSDGRNSISRDQPESCLVDSRLMSNGSDDEHSGYANCKAALQVLTKSFITKQPFNLNSAHIESRLIAF